MTDPASRPLRVLIACEYTGMVRRAFATRGHQAISCDLMPAPPGAPPGTHLQCDVREVLAGHDGQSWDLLIAHPPCTHLCSAGARYWPHRLEEQARAIAFVRELMAAPIPRICIENPIGILSRAIRPPTQIIQPWHYGHLEVKATCLWLTGLPRLRPTDIRTNGRYRVTESFSPSIDRWQRRAATYPGIAEAMAQQWGGPTAEPRAGPTDGLR